MNFLLFDSFIPIKIFHFEGSSGLSLFSGSVFFASLAVVEEVSQDMAAQQE